MMKFLQSVTLAIVAAVMTASTPLHASLHVSAPDFSHPFLRGRGLQELLCGTFDTITGTTNEPLDFKVYLADFTSDGKDDLKIVVDLQDAYDSGTESIVLIAFQFKYGSLTPGSLAVTSNPSVQTAFISDNEIQSPNHKFGTRNIPIDGGPYDIGVLPGTQNGGVDRVEIVVSGGSTSLALENIIGTQWYIRLQSTDLGDGSAKMIGLITENDCDGENICHCGVGGDATAPVLTCPVGAGIQCRSDVPAAGTATVTDNCSGPSQVATFTDGQLVGTTCGGTITRTFTAKDICANEGSCNQIIAVDDTTKPTITCPADEELVCGAAPTFGYATATDNCDLEVEITPSGDLPSCDNKQSFITWTATDDCGNKSSCTQKLNYKDDLAPSWDCQTLTGISCPGESINYCTLLKEDFTPDRMGWTDNCGLQGLVQADTIDSTEGAECEDTVVARAYEGPDDQCGNKLADYEASFTITKPDASYVLSAASSTLECGSKLDWEVTKTLCSETALFHMGKAAVETTCGMKEVEITYQPTCGNPIMGTLDVVVDDTIMPVFDCIASGTCPPVSATVCELPSPFELCATDACQGKLCDTPDPIAVGCEGGNFEYQWQVTEPGCKKLASSMLKASYSLPSRTPSFVDYAGKQTQLCDPEALPIVCAQVPACSGVDKDYSAYIECSNNDIGNQGVFVFGQVDQSGACNGVYRVNVTYTSTHGCKVTKSVEYASGCCCDTAFAVFDINHPSGDDSQCFIDDPLQTDSSKFPLGGFNRWGWTIGPVASGYKGTHNVYAGAGQCNLVNGENVGTAHIGYFGGTVMVTMVASGPQNSRFTSSHVYIGTNPYPTVAKKYTVAPGQYGNVRTHDPAATTFVVTKTGLSGPVYVIVHWDSVYACIAA